MSQRCGSTLLQRCLRIFLTIKYNKMKRDIHEKLNTFIKTYFSQEEKPELRLYIQPQFTVYVLYYTIYTILYKKYLQHE